MAHNGHVKTDLSHELFYLRQLGLTEPLEFENVLGDEVYKTCFAKVGPPRWVKLSQRAMETVISYDQVIIAGRIATEIYNSEIVLSERNQVDLELRVEEAISRVRKSVAGKLTKMAPLCDPALGLDFLQQIALHYASNGVIKKVEMQLDKLQALVGSKVDSDVKVRWLRLWNSTEQIRKDHHFPIPAFEPALRKWMDIETWWVQMEKRALFHKQELEVSNSLGMVLQVQSPPTIDEYIANLKKYY